MDFMEGVKQPAERQVNPSIAKAVLSAIVTHWSPRGEMRPTKDRLASIAGCSERSVARAIQDLQEMGLIRVEGVHNKPNRYYLTSAFPPRVEKVVDNQPGPEVWGDSPSPLGGQSVTLGGQTGTRTKPGTQPLNSSISQFSGSSPKEPLFVVDESELFGEVEETPMTPRLERLRRAHDGTDDGSDD